MTRQQVENVLRNARIHNRLQVNGIQVKYERRLMKITNTEWCWGGHLKDGTCHYRQATEISGNTYAVKEIIKKHGFKWDAKNKVWYAEQSSFDYAKMGGELCRHVTSA